jgi:hypothetical protein
VDLISVEDYGSDGDSLFGHEGGGGWRPRATDLLERGHDGTEAHWWSPMVVGEREREGGRRQCCLGAHRGLTDGEVATRRRWSSTMEELRGEGARARETKE